MRSKIIICLLFVSLLFGCSVAKPVETMTVTDSVTTTAAAEPATSAVTSTTATTTTTTTTSTTKKEQSTTKKATTSKAAEITKNAEKTTKHTTTKKHTTTTTATTTVNKGYCTITIECTDILDNMDDLKEGYEEYVPKSGYILSNYKVKYQKGDTVYSVLQRACRDKGIKMGAKTTGYGMYVFHINYLYEKICGKTSGWTYYVDGKFPPVAVDKYDLHGGEKIVFRYSCGV